MLNSVTAHPCKAISTVQGKTLLDTVLEKYDTRGFNVTIINEENEFNISQFKEYLLPTMVEIYGKYEHVEIIEIFIRVMK